MRSRVIAVTAAALAATAALAQPAHAAPLPDGIYRFAALTDGKCLVWPAQDTREHRCGVAGRLR
ncbi:hypothetical protein AB0N79_38240 [Streptomyces microflavus]|uniref:hypothetical protein n=1 Tax=Streptomyces microflavus TaxID=1919 RepID=UPI003412E8B6